MIAVLALAMMRQDCLYVNGIIALQELRYRAR